MRKLRFREQDGSLRLSAAAMAALRRELVVPRDGVIVTRSASEALRYDPRFGLVTA